MKIRKTILTVSHIQVSSTSLCNQEVAYLAFAEDESLKLQVNGPIWNCIGNAVAVCATAPHFREVSNNRWERKAVFTMLEPTVPNPGIVSRVKTIQLF